MWLQKYTTLYLSLRLMLIDNIMDQAFTFIIDIKTIHANQFANETIRELLAKALEDEKTFVETWKKFFKAGE